METTTKIGAQALEQSGQALRPEPRSDHPEADIRALRDWELLLVGGGDGTPDWGS